MRKYIFIGIIGLLIFVDFAFGVTSLKFTAELAYRSPQESVGVVSANEMVIMRLPAEKRQEAIRRAGTVAQRLQSLADEGLMAQEISLSKLKGQYLIKGRSKIIVTIDKLTAKRARNSMNSLVMTWSENIKRALKLPHLVIHPGRIIVPFQERRHIVVSGVIKEAISAKDFDTRILEVDISGNVIQVKGRQTGKTSMRVASGTESLIIYLWVKKYAGRVISGAKAAVTGRLVPKRVLQKAVFKAIEASLNLEPQAYWQTEFTREFPEVLPSGSSRKVYMPVKITGPDYIPVEDKIEVNINNLPLKLREPALLFVSNNPEKILRKGFLFSGKVGPNQAARLLVHHQNCASSDLNLVVELSNLSHLPAEVHLIESLPPPSRSPLYAGHHAMKRFLLDYLDNTGYVCQIPPGKSYMVSSLAVPKGETISGLLELQILNPAELELKIYAQEPAKLIDPPMMDKHIVPNPSQKIKAAYKVGERWTFITIGKSSGKILGDYGILYEIDLEVINPTKDEAKVEVVFSPQGGVARGSFLVDDKFFETGIVSPPHEVPIVKFLLPAGSRKQIKIKTMPEAGSHYPAYLIVRPAGYSYPPR